MPEGDTVHKLARALAPELEGRPVDRIWLRDRDAVEPLAGRRVREVAALGKHLLIALADVEGDGRLAPARRDQVLHVHLGMRGRWHRYRVDESWQRPRAQAALALDVDGHSYVCFRAAVAELVRRVELPQHPALSRLGPDLLAADVALDRVVARARRREPGPVAELLLDQRVACGIGNVYKSEVLFLEGLAPRTPVSALSDEQLRRTYERASGLMGQNLGGWRRTTLRRVTRETAPRPGEPRLWVYDRAGEPCRRCGRGIRSERLGDAARNTWWCPRCQA